MSPTLAARGKESGTARVLGSGTSGMFYFANYYPVEEIIAPVLTGIRMRANIGIAELLIFHPVDTIAKRLMSNKAKVSPYSPLCTLTR
jgi:hypothetical protein